MATDDDKVKAAIAPYLTLDNARTWEGKTDKFVWVIDHILMEADAPQTDANVAYVEDAFDAILLQEK